jgi:hypothetical protein
MQGRTNYSVLEGLNIPVDEDGRAGYAKEHKEYDMSDALSISEPPIDGSAEATRLETALAEGAGSEVSA